MPRLKHKNAKPSRNTIIVHDADHSGGAPTIGDTGIRVANVAGASEYNGYSPDQIAGFYPTLTLEDIHTAIAYFYGHPDEFDATPTPPRRGDGRSE